MRRPEGAKGVLDEREMQDLYRIEHSGLRLMYALLCAAILAQLLLGAGFAQMAGELIVLAVTSVALIVAYARRGIWDEDARPSVGGNAAYAALSGVAVALVALCRRSGALRAAALGALAFGLCFALLCAMMRCVQRSQRKRERELEDEG